MNLNELEAIPLIMLYGSYAGASKASGIPVSTLSKWVAKVERELGVMLFERKTYRNSVTLTEEGKALMPSIQRLVNTNAFMCRRVAHYQGKAHDSLTVGLEAMTNGAGVSELLSDYLAQNPSLDLVSVFLPQSDIPRLLSDGKAECAFFLCISDDPAREIRQIFSADQYEIVPVSRSDTLYICISENDPLSKCAVLSMDELKYQRFLFDKRREQDRRTQGRGLRFFECMGRRTEDYEVGFEDFLNSGYIFSLAARGAGVVPQLFLPRRSIPGVRFVPLKDWRLTGSMFLVGRRIGSRQLRDFLDYTRTRGVQ